MNVISSNGLRKIFTLLKNKIDQNKCKVYSPEVTNVVPTKGNASILSRFTIPENGCYLLIGKSQINGSYTDNTFDDNY